MFALRYAASAAASKTEVTFYTFEPLARLDKKPDRCEISPEDMVRVSKTAEDLRHVFTHTFCGVPTTKNVFPVFFWLQIWIQGKILFHCTWMMGFLYVVSNMINVAKSLVHPASSTRGA